MSSSQHNMNNNVGLLLLLVLHWSYSSGCGILGGYYKASWKFRVSNIKRACSYNILFYRHAALKEEGHVEFSNVLYDEVDYKTFNALLKSCPNQKTAIVIEGDGMWPSILSDRAKSELFVQTATDHMVAHGFQGIQISWIRPAPTPEDANKLSAMLKELRRTMDDKQEGSLLSVAIPGRSESLAAINLQEISKHVGLIIPVVENDYLRGNRTLLYSPLRGPSSVDETLSKCVEAGVPPKKLGIYVPVSASVHTLLNEDDNSICAPIKDTRRPKRLSFTQVQTELSSNEKCEFHLAEKQGGSYVTCGDQWVGAEEQISIHAKALYSCNKGLGGLFIADLGDDDPFGDTGFPFPLSAIVRTTFIQYSRNRKPVLNDKSQLHKTEL